MPPVKVESVEKLVPSAWRANTVPWPKVPPTSVIPYRMLLDETKSTGPAPSLFALQPVVISSLNDVKLCRFVKVCALSADVSRSAVAQQAKSAGTLLPSAND